MPKGKKYQDCLHMKTNTITAVPRLRFPDFISDVGWKIEKLEEVTHSISSGKDNKVSYAEETVQVNLVN